MFDRIILMEKAEEHNITEGSAVTGSCVPSSIGAEDHLLLSTSVAGTVDC